MADDLDQTEGGGPSVPEVPRGEPPSDRNVEPARSNLVGEWAKRIRKAKTHFEKDFKRMRRCQQIAAEGDDEAWIAKDKYTAPVLVRHVNYVVDKLYARNPRAVAKRKRKLMFQLWDGSPQTAEAALMQSQPQPTGVVDMTGQPIMQPGDPQAAAIIQEIQQVKTQIKMEEKLGKTLEILWDYYTSEQAQSFKKRLKKLVRRTKVNGVGFVKIDFQRALEPRPDVAAEIDDITSKIASIEEMTARGETGDLSPQDADVEALRLSLADLENQRMAIVREGVVFAFPRTTQVIVDPQCDDLDTFAGADWIAVEYDMTPGRVQSIYKVDVGKSYTSYSDKDQPDAKGMCRIWEVWDRKNRQTFTICEGHQDFLREPQTPIVELDRFFPVFSLIFNGIEHDKKLYPPSDIWLARHAQRFYNTSREALEEHREANRPYYVGASGVLEEKDQRKLANHASFEYLELNVPATESFDIQRIVQRGPSIPIDPNQYEVNPVFEDIQRTVGSQEANFGGATGATATESTIAEGSQSAGLASNVDSLDDLLSDLAHSFSHISLAELDIGTVKEIAGPGAVWPETPPTREQIAKDLTLTVKAGSSGRPNKAAELANMERGMPFIVQFPGLNPAPILEKYLELLDIDVEGAIVDGMPSITALNAMASGQAAGQATGDPQSDPNAQGPEGANNAEQPAGAAPGPQPAFPAGAAIG